MEPQIPVPSPPLWLIGILGLVAVTLAYCGDLRPAPAHEGDDNLSRWYRSLSTPEGGSCCSEKDCQPTEARLVGDHWEALTPAGWKAVPADRILRRDNQDGRPVVCMYDGKIICFIPPSGA